MKNILLKGTGGLWAFMLLWVFINITASCKKETPDPIPDEEPVILDLTPPGFPPMAIPENNKPTKARIELGRKLYYDPILSNDGRACATCHNQKFGFYIPTGGVNVLPHINLAWNKYFLWDGSKTGTLEEMMLFEVKDFFGTDIHKINASDEYRKRFKEAYETPEISEEYIAMALANFFRTLSSYNSKFDRFMRREVNLTPDERNGMFIFFSEKGDCYHCHSELFFTNNLFANNGLDSSFAPGMRGRYEITGNPLHLGQFKVPTLRNAALRGRYMHDGRFSTLEEVIEFYHSGVKTNSPNIDSFMITPDKIYGQRFTAKEKGELIAFLKTLTDTVFTNNPLLAAP